MQCPSLSNTILLQKAVGFLTVVSLFLPLKLKGSEHFTPRHIRTTILAETKYNPAVVQSSDELIIEHIEAPLSAVRELKLLTVDPDVYKALIFERSNQKFVRLIVNPDDGFFKETMLRYFLNHQIPHKIERYFKAFRSASRSFFIQDPVSKKFFSFKTSTKKAVGPWPDKKLSSVAAEASILLSNYVISFPPTQDMTLRFLPETLAFTLDDVDLGFSVRQYPHFLNLSSDRLVIPFFSALQTDFGSYIAHVNGASDPEEFWSEHGMKKIGQAMAELVFYYGIGFSSPHAQNFMIELDQSFRPTGKIYLRDFSDSDLFEKILRARGQQQIIDFWEDKVNTNIIHRGRILPHATFSPLGKLTPQWLFNQREFFESYVQGFRQQSVAITGMKEFAQFSSLFNFNENFSRSVITYGQDKENLALLWEKHAQNLSHAVRAACEPVFAL